MVIWEIRSILHFSQRSFSYPARKSQCQNIVFSLKNSGWIVREILYTFYYVNRINQWYLSNDEASRNHIYFNDKNCVLLNPGQEFIETEASLLLTFFTCLQNQTRLKTC